MTEEERLERNRKAREYYHNNRDVLKKRQRENIARKLEEDPEAYRVARKTYYAKNAEKRREYVRRQRLANPEHYREMDRKRHSADPERKRGFWLKSKFGITLEQYAAMEAAQDSRCAVCGDLPKTIVNGKPQKLAVDHNHQTGKVRALLCANCNVALGMVKDQAWRLDSLIDYLHKHEPGPLWSGPRDSLSVR